MIPTSFDESNGTLSPPAGVPEEDVGSLSVWRGLWGDQPVVISCWKMTAEELAEVNRTGRVWLALFGASMPPALVAGQSPFKR